MVFEVPIEIKVLVEHTSTCSEHTEILIRQIIFLYRFSTPLEEF